MARMKFLADAERCIECNGCVTACKQEHEIPWGVNRRRVVTMNDGSILRRDARVAFVDGERKLLHIVLQPSCATASCGVMVWKSSGTGVVVIRLGLSADGT